LRIHCSERNKSTSMSQAVRLSLGKPLTNTYAELSPAFYTLQQPVAVKSPELVLFNTALASDLGWDTSESSEADIAEMLSGNVVPEGGISLAQAYAGHQFGHFNMLGDGRAILLGEMETPDGQRYDVQLKGSGKTRYSRGGDGRATLKSMLREYLISEAMHGLGIATTRSLAIVGTGQPVIRETIQPGAVLTRIAKSHIRVGTVEFARQFLEESQQRQLLDYLIQRHYPEVNDAPNRALGLLTAIMEKQVALITEWMRVGFIHGVMNTDNMSLAGETIDYGPCAFMNAYHPGTKFSSIDTQGRYAYGNQPRIAHWNLSCLAGALLPLMHQNEQKAIAMAQAALNRFPELYQKSWLNMMRKKLGWIGEEAGDELLINQLLDWMQGNQADYTNTFLGIQEGDFSLDESLADHGFQEWYQQWKIRATQNGASPVEVREKMVASNPVYIPRNHQVELALDIAVEHNDYGKFTELLSLLQQPYRHVPGKETYQSPPEDGDQGYRTFCGT
jgi:serine/tyrosine/threonine adenylyltransferase